MQFNNVYENKSVFITGHTGFKGSWIAEWLLKLKAKITGFSLDPPTKPSHFALTELSERIANDIRGDIRDYDSVRRAIFDCKPDFIFHLAAQPIVRKAFKEPLDTVLTNFVGTLNILESIRELQKDCVAIMITTDKVYENREWYHSYREPDELGGIDPYSASKACAETIILSYFRSFFRSNLLNNRHPRKAVTSVRAGNVIGGGDWGLDRIVPDCIRNLEKGEKIPVRNRTSTRPWQHVLEPLSGYLLLGSRLYSEMNSSEMNSIECLKLICSPFNFGPSLASNRTVLEIVQEALKHWPGNWEDRIEANAPHEAGKLNLTVDKAFHLLGWQPNWDFNRTVKETISWYRNAFESKYDKALIREYTQNQIDFYSSTILY
ncbi:MAG: CDP-glucose 4,6-dehydratase [bacterium]